MHLNFSYSRVQNVFTVFQQKMKQSGKVKLWDSLFVLREKRWNVLLKHASPSQEERKHRRATDIGSPSVLGGTWPAHDSQVSLHTPAQAGAILTLWLVELLGGVQIQGRKFRLSSHLLKLEGWCCVQVKSELTAFMSHITWTHHRPIVTHENMKHHWVLKMLIGKFHLLFHSNLQTNTVTEWHRRGNSRCVRKLDNTEVNTHKDTPFQQEVNRKWSVTGDDSNYF